MYRHKVKPKGRHEPKRVQEKNGSQEQNHLQLIIKSLPETVGFFYVFGFKNEDYINIARKLNFYVKNRFPKEHSELDFQPNIDSINSFIHKMIVIVESDNKENEYYKPTVVKYDNESQELKVCKVVNDYYEINHVTADTILKLKNKKLKELYALFLKCFNKISIDDVVSEFNSGFNYCDHLYEMNTENYQYELESLEELTENLKGNKQPITEETEQDLIQARIDVEANQHNIKIHAENVETIAKTVNEIAKKADLEKLSKHKFRDKNVKEFAQAMINFINVDYDLIGRESDYNTDEDSEDSFWTDCYLMTSAYGTDDECFDQMYSKERTSMIQNNGVSAICSYEILKEDSIIESDKEGLIVELSKLNSSISLIIKHIDNETNRYR